MTIRRLFLLLLTALWGGSFSCIAQVPLSYALPSARGPGALMLVGAAIITPAEVAADDVVAVNVFHADVLSADPSVAARLCALKVWGIAVITSRKRVRSNTFARVGRQLGLRGPLEFALNGQPLASDLAAELRITPAAIGQVHIRKPTPEAPATRVDIWLTEIPRPNYPPGTVMIR